jgi:hypothetical protein
MWELFMTNVKICGFLFEQRVKKVDLLQFIICPNNLPILITAIGD